MTILGKVIAQIKTTEKTEQMRSVCEKIYQEEAGAMEYIEFGPKGPNILLTLQVPGHTTKHVGFLTLERESEMLYLSTYWALLKSDIIEGDPEKTLSARKIKVWQINEDKVEKILTAYARTFKFLKGE